MIVADIPENEAKRLEAVYNLDILDTQSEADYDHISKLAAYICDTDISLITIIDQDRQWFKSKKGITACSTTRDSSFCSHAILTPNEILEVPDARKDLRFVENPLIKSETPVIFYAGVPLLTPDGLPMGSLCVIDSKPKVLTEGQRSALKSLGQQVERLFELRLKNRALEELKDSLSKHNDLLKDFAGTVSHDLKMPLANLILTSDILKKKYEGLLDETGLNYLGYLKKSSLSMSKYITNILAHYESTAYDREDTHYFQLNEMLEELVDLLDIKFDCEVHFPEINYEIQANRSGLEQIFLNLIGNSLKYNDKEHTVISIEAQELDGLYEFSVRDNGRGIEEDKIDSIFTLFSTIGHLDRDGEKGHGIGLSTVEKLVSSFGGTIKVVSDIGKYSEFIFTIKK